jgi:hypothetical protein
MKEVKIEIPDGYEIDQEKSTFEKIVFKPCMKVDSVEAACRALGECDKDVKELRKLQKAGCDCVLQSLVVAIKSFNEGWEPDWNNSNQYKYMAYYNMGGGAPTFDGWAFHHSYSYVPSRLCFPTKEKVEEFVKIKEFNNLYIKYLM